MKLRKTFSFHIFEIWVLDYKQTLKERKKMHDPINDPPRHTSLMDRRFPHQSNERIEELIQEVRMVKVILSAVLGALVGALVYFILT